MHFGFCFVTIGKRYNCFAVGTFKTKPNELHMAASCLLLLHSGKIGEPLLSVLDYICNVLIGAAPLVLVVHWLLFVEYTLHQSKDLIMRRYPVAMIPFCVGVIMTILSCTIPIPDSAPDIIINLDVLVYRAGILIFGFYILASYVILYKEKKRKLVPEYIRLTPSVISIAAGMVLSSLTPYLMDGLGFAIGLMFADYYMFKRLSYIDPTTGFFNEKYITVLEREVSRKDIRGGTVIRFRTSGNIAGLAEILKYWKPEDSKIIIRNDGEFLVIARTQEKNIVERFMSLVCEHGKRENLEIESSYETTREEEALP